MNELTTDVTAISNLKQMKVIIKAELESLVDGFVALGYYLKRTRDTEMFAEEGYENIFDFAKKEFNLGRSSVYTYMGINDHYSIGGNSPELSDEYRGYGSSKLGEMLTLTDEQMQDLTPDATIKDIREYKKVVNEIESPDVWTNGLNTQSEPTFNEVENIQNGLKEFVSIYFKGEGRNIFEKSINIVLSAAGDKETQLMFAIAPSKFKLIRIPGGSVICNADNISIMKAGKPKKSYTYEYLIEVILHTFQPTLNEPPKETFKRYYQEDLVPPVPVKVEIKTVKEEKTVTKEKNLKVITSSKEEDSEDEEEIEENEENTEEEEDSEVDTNEVIEDEIEEKKVIIEQQEESFPEITEDTEESEEVIQEETIVQEVISEEGEGQVIAYVEDTVTEKHTYDGKLAAEVKEIGCKYCTKHGKGIESDLGKFEIHINALNGVANITYLGGEIFEGDSIKINNCFNCGRELTHES